MRSPALAATLAAGLVVALASGCAVRDQPYRFGSPMLGAAELPPPPLPGAPPPARHEIANRHRPSPDTRSSRDAQPIRVATAPKIREASAAAAAQITETPAAQETSRAVLPGPHRIAATVPLPAVRELAHLRALVGRRDKRDPIAVALAWAHELGLPIEGDSGPELIAWAERSNRLAEPTVAAMPGDLLVFDHVSTDAERDLIALVITRDDRGVTEYIYLGGGVIRRGFVDPARPTVRRDTHDRVVNTFLRHGKRWPAKGSHYLAGELIAHVIRTR